MAANAWQVFDVFYDELAKETHNLNGVDVIKMALILVGWAPDLQNDLSFSVVDGDEHAANFGYVAGGSILARYAVLYNTAAPGAVNDLIAYCLMDNSPADVEATDGNTLTVTINASGVFTITQP